MAEKTTQLREWLKDVRQGWGSDELLSALEALERVSLQYSDKEIGHRLDLLKERYCS